MRCLYLAFIHRRPSGLEKVHTLIFESLCSHHVSCDRQCTHLHHWLKHLNALHRASNAKGIHFRNSSPLYRQTCRTPIRSGPLLSLSALQHFVKRHRADDLLTMWNYPQSTARWSECSYLQHCRSVSLSGDPSRPAQSLGILAAAVQRHPTFQQTFPMFAIPSLSK